MSGVDSMLYMYSISQTSGGQMQLRVDFDLRRPRTTGAHESALLTGRVPAPPDVVTRA